MAEQNQPNREEGAGRPRRSRRQKGTGSVFRRGRYWVAQVQDGYRENGLPRYRQVQRKTQAEAVRALNELTAKVTLGVPMADGRAPSLAEWLDRWLEEHVRPNLAPKTHAFYRLFVEKLKPCLEKKDLKRVTPDDVNKIFARLRRAEGGAASDSAVDAARRTLRAAFGVAVRLGLCADNPVARAGAVKVRRKDRPRLTEEQAAALLKALEGSEIERLVRFTLATALRVGEATGLQWEGVSLEPGAESFEVRNQLQRLRLEGEPKSRLVLRPLKTERSRRTLPLVLDALEAVKAEKARQKEAGFENPLGLVFLNPQGRPFDQKYVDVRLKAALRRAGLRPMGMHALRHSAITFMLMKGMNLHMASRFAGHSSITLTSDTYGGVLDRAMREAAEAVQSGYLKRS